MFVWEAGEINKDQEDAINALGSVLLVACPGSGKTRTLTYKIALELSKLSDDKKYVLAITYTHKAADEIKERIELLGVDTSRLWIGTIHSFCYEWLLKPYSIYHENLSDGFKILNTYDSEELITTICSNYKNEKINFYDCNHYYTSEGLRLSGYFNKHGAIKNILDEYHLQMRENNQIDFEQMLYFSFQLISKESISKILSGIFSYIFIDEFQDTKEIQYAIIAKIIKSSESKINAFVVGDPNQAIYGSLGGYAISKDELEEITSSNFSYMTLDKNYRSSHKIIDFYSNFNVLPSNTSSESKFKNYPSLITYNQTINKENLVDHISKYIEYNVSQLGIEQKEICILAPWWMHLAALTRNLVTRLPGYSFDGPGLVPFSRDIDNFWFKVTQIILTEPSPNMYVKRIRWVSDILSEMSFSHVNVQSLSPKIFLNITNDIKIDDIDGLSYLEKFFNELFKRMNVDIFSYPMLQEHYDSFFKSSQDRINRLKKDNEHFATDINAFRNAFKPRTGIKVSTIHGVKGGEYDTVISFGLLQDMVPNFNDSSDESAKKLLYVIGSRARKNLHLISERGRKSRYKQYESTKILSGTRYTYGQDPF
ncbi:ATP-dependent helicase [Citrobacter sp. FDAARGOS_156]|uniref:UvrD-helicase domain-containing protein n=1 Tax=Citrobacter sp. FDAARGOS_156 TaxID=1702170 RepID=UPI0019020CB9|nr:ATP-dependent helicase [Citrobacter sp. FDAARGOS_156]MBJ8889346.1 ATP-dependent helicase [Citrobacter sp. FDAARGOS_156]